MNESFGNYLDYSNSSSWNCQVNQRDKISKLIEKTKYILKDNSDDTASNNNGIDNHKQTLNR